MHLLQIFRFTSSKPSKSARAPDGKFTRQLTTSFNQRFPKLVIELDGYQHYEPDAERYDEERTSFLQSQGLSVLRILNADVNDRFEGVCMLIDKTVWDKIGSMVDYDA